MDKGSRKKSTKEGVKAGVLLAGIVVIFILISYLAQNKLINLGFFSDNVGIIILFYMAILVAEAVIAPINTMPLIPLASEVFGWWQAAIYTLIGWTLGAFIVFILSQKYGKLLIRKLISLEKLEKYERIIPTEHIFMNIVILRLFMPLDIVSYALGLFTNVKKGHYLLATLIGYAPLAFFVAYLGTVSTSYQIIGAVICIIVISIEGALLIRKKRLMDEVKLLMQKTKKKLDNKRVIRKETRLLRKEIRLLKRKNKV
jgi:uncharacterized membrane protein YdjX (TVP38/TMEM64 family)